MTVHRTLAGIAFWLFVVGLSLGAAADNSVDFKYYLTVDALNVRARIIATPGGEVIKLLTDSPQARGPKTLTWDGTDSQGRRVDSGIYIYDMRVDLTSTISGTTRYEFRFIK